MAVSASVIRNGAMGFIVFVLALMAYFNVHVHLSIARDDADSHASFSPAPQHTTGFMTERHTAAADPDSLRPLVSPQPEIGPLDGAAPAGGLRTRRRQAGQLPHGVDRRDDGRIGEATDALALFPELANPQQAGAGTGAQQPLDDATAGVAAQQTPPPMPPPLVQPQWQQGGAGDETYPLPDTGRGAADDGANPAWVPPPPPPPSQGQTWQGQQPEQQQQLQDGQQAAWQGQGEGDGQAGGGGGGGGGKRRRRRRRRRRQNDDRTATADAGDGVDAAELPQDVVAPARRGDGNGNLRAGKGKKRRRRRRREDGASGGRNGFPDGVPTTIAEQASLPNPLTKEQRHALYNHCKDKTSSIKFFTYANIRGKDDKYCRFLESVVQNGIDMTVLNWGGEHRGNGNKLVFTRKMLKTLDPCDTFIFSDAFDVLYAEGADEIRRKFFDVNAPIMVSAECGCWPFIAHKNGDDICLRQFPKSPTDYRYINSGMWGARAYAAEDLIRRIMEANSLARVQKMSDQEQISNLLLKGDYDWGKDIQIDYYASVFLNMHMADDYGRCYPEQDVVFQDGRLYNRHTKFVPSMYHFNGGSKRRMGHAEQAMWYKQRDPISPVKELYEVMAAPVRIADRNMRFSTVTVEDMCPDYNGDSLMRAGQANYFKRRH